MQEEESPRLEDDDEAEDYIQITFRSVRRNTDYLL